MQFTTLSVALFGALAAAHQHAPQHFHHRRHLDNSTSYDTGASTTLTVAVTSLSTVYSCAPSVTNCPAHPEQATNAVVETHTIAVTTTVCPVEQAASVSSDYIASYQPASTSATVTPAPTVGPISTGGSDYEATGGPSGSDSVVLTYTLGTGTSTTVVTTTIKHTSTSTVYATSGTAEAGEGGSKSEEPTTTITGTSTSTRWITVYPVTSSAAGGDVVDAAAASTSGGAETCVPVTVTATVALSTVTVTETAVPTATPSGCTTTSSDDSGSDESSPDAGSSPYSSDAVVIQSTATVVPVPVTSGAPYGNGTSPEGYATSSGKKYSTSLPSGFTSAIKPSPIPTGY